MRLMRWDQLPEKMKNEAVRKYYNHLKNKQISLLIKRIFDVLLSIVLIALLLPLFICIAFAIKIDSKGPIFFRQVRVTQYGKKFEIFKFRTMVQNASQMGAQVTTQKDPRITKIGRCLRKIRLDETPQLFNVLIGNMTFVGTRPEVVRYVEHYTDEMLATLLLPAGVTSMTSIEYKDEEELLKSAKDADKTYIETILPEKMKMNLRDIETFSLTGDIKVIVKTVQVVMVALAKSIKAKVIEGN